jgi:hypothetical protein
MKTVILSALRCALNIKTKILILLLALTCSARATFIETGRITFSGDFTLNHLYDFNNQSAQPFGSFGAQTALHRRIGERFACAGRAGTVYTVHCP